MIRIAPSILSADFARLGEEINDVARAGADWIHIDVMDGHFVPNLTIGPLVVEAIRKITPLTLDVHLMIENPDDYIDAFCRAGSDIITVHYEACTHLHRTVHSIKEHGVKAGVAINPATPLQLIEPILADIDLLLIMTVNPGFGGQTFISSTLEKIRAAHSWKAANRPNLHIEVDGGVNDLTAGQVIAAGADVLVAGNAIFKQSDRVTAIRNLRSAIQ
jgi:ribulose-phosphate 3-epimerase